MADRATTATGRGARPGRCASICRTPAAAASRSASCRGGPTTRTGSGTPMAAGKRLGCWRGKLDQTPGMEAEDRLRARRLRGARRSHPLHGCLGSRAEAGEYTGRVRLSFAAIQGADARDDGENRLERPRSATASASRCGCRSAPIRPQPRPRGQPEWMTSAVPISTAVAKPARVHAGFRPPPVPTPVTTAAREAPAPETPANDARAPDRTPLQPSRRPRRAPPTVPAHRVQRRRVQPGRHAARAGQNGAGRSPSLDDVRRNAAWPYAPDRPTISVSDGLVPRSSSPTASRRP